MDEEKVQPPEVTFETTRESLDGREEFVDPPRVTFDTRVSLDGREEKISFDYNRRARQSAGRVFSLGAFAYVFFSFFFFVFLFFFLNSLLLDISRARKSVEGPRPGRPR
jgi:hypothetical protein